MSGSLYGDTLTRSIESEAAALVQVSSTRSKLPTPALQHTTNLLRLYLHAHDYESSQVPRNYHIWSFISILAAVAQDKFFFCKLAGESLKPNLYVMLIGPSGLGKDTAINCAFDYLRPFDQMIRRFVGRTTNAAFLDFLCKQDFDPLTNKRFQLPAKVLLVTHELAQAIGDGSRAQEFLKLMVMLYTATSREIEEHTRQYGHFKALNPCISWIAGTTAEWLVQTIGVKQLRGGVLRRLIPIVEDYHLDHFKPWAAFPEDYEEVVRYIQARLQAIVYSEGGQMYLSTDARIWFDTWYEDWIREAKLLDDPVLMPLYASGHDLVLKLSMLICIAEGGSLVIQAYQIQQATVLLKDLLDNHYQRLTEYSYMGGGALGDLKVIEYYLKRAPLWEMPLSELLKKVYRKGLDKRRMHEALAVLQQQNEISPIAKTNSKAIWFKWTGK